jgi:NADPH-dependent ferric siderophore reductase
MEDEMAPPESGPKPTRIRREPPRFRVVAVRGVETLTPSIVRLTLAGEELEGFAIPEPAASVRLLIASPGADRLVMPAWNGNEFLLADGSRPIIRTFTPRRFDVANLALDLDVVIHQGGAVSEWVERVTPGTHAAISGPGRGYTIDPNARSFLLAGDQTALPAISQLIEALPPSVAVDAIIEIPEAAARLTLPDHPRLRVTWVEAAIGTGLVEAVEQAQIEVGAKVWVAGEAAAMHRVRRHLFEDRGLSRSDATVRGYWKHGR